MEGADLKSDITFNWMNDLMDEGDEVNNEEGGEITMEDCWEICWLDTERCLAHEQPKANGRNCKKNPYCIHYLGLEKFDKLARTQQSRTPAVRRDIPAEPCGLVNSGNFCYVNSFLQTWFNDLKFRQCIYNWRPSTDWTMPTNARLDVQAVMNCLKQLFLTMQFTPAQSTDAQDFIKLLRLDNQQQDVQEFHTLFFDTITRNLQTHPNGQPVLDTIRHLFQSRMSQTVSCNFCDRASETIGEHGSLQIGIDGHNTLVSAIQSFFAPEQLSEFRCDQCGMRGANRSIRFTQIPEVLIFQLNRYVVTSRGLRKLQNAVHYPRILTADDLNLQGNVSFDLSAVMIHEGKTTNSGHYYDIIRDPIIEKWFIYNDQNVKPRRGGAPGYSGRLTGRPRDTAETKGCYALIYRRMTTDRSAPLQLPFETVAEVEKKLEDEFTQSETEDDKAFKKWKQHIANRSLWLQNLWKELELKDGNLVYEHPNRVAFLPLKVLSELLAKELSAVEECKPLNATYKPGRVADTVIPLCEHGRVPPGPFTRCEMKAVNASAAQKLIKDFNVNVNLCTGDQICLICCARLRDHQETRPRNAQTGERLYYPEGADVFIKHMVDSNGDDSDKKGNMISNGPASAATRRAAAKRLIRIRLCSDETINTLKVRIYEQTDYSPVDQLIYFNEQTMDGNLTLERARIPAGNVNNPLILIVQHQTKNEEDDANSQKAGSSGGFGDTALS